MAGRNRKREEQESSLRRGFVDTYRAADYVGLSHRTMEKYRWTGGGPEYVKLGRRCLYKPSELDRWMEEGRRRSTSDLGNEQQ